MEDTRPKAFVFVLMPFDKDFDDIYNLGIKAACKEAGAFCERVDEQIFDENILERVFNQIAKADIIVSEMTGRNPNVFYETGYAHALNKRTILLTKNAKDIPFDLQHFPHIVYNSSISELKKQLEKRVRWSIENPKGVLASADPCVEILINDSKLGNEPNIDVQVPNISKKSSLKAFYITISIHNTGDQVLTCDLLDIAFVLPSFIQLRNDLGRKWKSTGLLPDKRNFYNIRLFENLFPDAWYQSSFELNIFDVPHITTGLACSLRVFSALGPKDYPFVLNLIEEPD